MTPERWRQIREVFEHAEPLGVAERATYLDIACAADGELRQEVESLLHYEGRAASTFLKTPAASLLGPLPAKEPASSRIGRRIGAYQIIDEIGRGGMGEVYRAVRADGQYEQQVAVKLVRVELDTSFILERFRHERQILASLDHPNIARLLDGGTTEEGLPYLVMELIDGVRIDDYCQRHCLSVTERLQLFLLVCAAVQYAHQRLVIHRDIKPGNILVTGDGAPKLLDFGIAKLLDPAAGAEATLVSPMTPEFASPEQVRGEAVTTATDVYSLGVVLYQLLTGHSPYRASAAAPYELSRAITDTQPLRPSSAVASGPGTWPAAPEAAESGQAIISTREATPAKLRRRLMGDLDNILLMSLRKEPERRYASVQQFAEDISRHLDGLPVVAGRGSWRYHAGKFVARHRVGVAATVAVLLALLAGIVATTREARIAQAERARAQRRFDDVRQLSNSLIFDVHNAIQNLPGSTPARKLLLDRAVEYLDRAARDASGDPDLERELAWGYQRLAVVQGNGAESNLGDVQAALASDRKALTLFQAVAKENPGSIIDQLNVAMMHRILAYSAIAEASGRRELAQATAITAGLLAKGTTDPRVRSERSLEYQNLGLSQDAAGDRAQALASYREYQKMRVGVWKSNPEYRQSLVGAATSTVMVGYAQARMGSRAEGLQLIDEGIARYESVPRGAEDVNVQRYLAISRRKRGDVLLMNGNDQAALSSYRQAQEALMRMAKTDPENDMLQNDLTTGEYLEGKVLASRGRCAEALPRLNTAMAAFKRYQIKGASGSESVRDSGEILLWLGEAYACQGNMRVALQTFQMAAAALAPGPEESDAIVDDTNCARATAYAKVGRVLAGMGKLGEAKSAYQRALDIAIPRAVPAFSNVPALYPIANAYAGLGEVSSALALAARGGEERSRLTEEACAAYRKSEQAWQKIPNPSRIDPSGFLSRVPSEVARLSSACSPRIAVTAQR